MPIQHNWEIETDRIKRQDKCIYLSSLILYDMPKITIAICNEVCAKKCNIQ